MWTEGRVIIVGAGLAGLAAADCLSAHGLKVLVIDENPHPGGQLLRSIPATPRKVGCFREGHERQGLALLARCKSRQIEWFAQAQVVGSDGSGRLWVDSPRAPLQELSADRILLATGARETFLPFPGWTLPGVISTGGAQLLIKGSGVLPASEMIIAGSGPLPLALAREVLKHKGRITALLDESRLLDSLGLLKLLPHQLPRLVQGLRLQARLLRAGIRPRGRMRIIAAQGQNQLEQISFARIDRTGAPIPGSETACPTPGLALGGGFVPNIELGREMGCEAEYDLDKGGWVLRVDESLATTTPGVYAAGEPTGIAGGRKALLEGEIAGLAIASRLDAPLSPQDQRRLTLLRRQRRHELRFGAFLHSLARIPAAGYRSIPGETTICRCEQVRLTEILNAVDLGFNTLQSVKKATRCGMGRCQGRTCTPILQKILEAHSDTPQENQGTPSVRSPIKPIALQSLLEFEKPPGYTDPP